MFKLSIEPTCGKSQIHDLELGTYTLGRGFSCDIRLSGKAIARRHALLTLGPDDISLSGLQNNKLQVNGEWIERLNGLVSGTEITIGDLRIVVLENRYEQRVIRPVDAATAVNYPYAQGVADLVQIESASSSHKSSAYLAEKRTLQMAIYQELDLYKRAVMNNLDAASLRAEAFSAAQKIVAVQGGFHLPEGITEQRFIKDVVAESIGLGPIEDLLADDTITEVMVNGPHAIYVERNGRIERSSACFNSDDSLRGVIERIVAPLGRRIDEGSPMVDARLADGSRVNAIIPPLSLSGPVLTIRKFSDHKYSLAGLVKVNSLSPRMADFLRLCVEHRKSMVISGGTGSGKTTFLNALSDYIPSDERIITIEDAAELRLTQDHVISLESRPANMEGRGEISIRDLVKNALRMRPDRIVVGECRGGEALDMLQAMNTGHEGSLTTAHANTPRELLSRLEVMVLMAGLDMPVRVIREQIAGSVDLIVQQARFRDGRRRVTSIVEVRGMERDVILLHKLFEFRQTGMGEDGMVQGYYTGLGTAPGFYDDLIHAGYELDHSLFALKEPQEATF